MEILTERGQQVSVYQVETQSETVQTREFIRQWYLKLWNAAPPPPEFLFVARGNTEILGTIGFDFCDKHGKFSLEKLFLFDHKQTPLPFEVTRIVQWSRWISRYPSVSKALIYKATRYALERGKDFGLCDQAYGPKKAATKIGIELLRVSNAILQMNQIPPTYREHYLGKSAPDLYMLKNTQILDVLADDVKQMRIEEPQIVNG